MIDYPVSTIAVSVHNAIAARGPMRAGDIAAFLREQWENADDDQVEEACEELLKRGYVRMSSNGVIDTVIRNAQGNRCPAPKRQRDPNKPNYGWW